MMLTGTSTQGRGELISLAAIAAPSASDAPTKTNGRGRKGLVPWSMVVLASLVGNTEAFLTRGMPPVGATTIGRGCYHVAPGGERRGCYHGLSLLSPTVRDSRPSSARGRQDVFEGRRDTGVLRANMANQGMSMAAGGGGAAAATGLGGSGGVGARRAVTAAAAVAVSSGRAYDRNVVVAAALAVYSAVASVKPAIIILATKAVLKLVASCAVGYGFSKKGVLDQTAITSLSKLIFFVFQPCLLFVNVASTLGTPGQKLSKLLVLPFFAVLQILFGSVVGQVMERVLRLTPGSPESRELRMCTSFANSGPLPLLFVDSIFGAHPDSSIVTTAVAYISFYLLGWSPMFWTAGYNMVAGKPQAAPPISEADALHFHRLTPLRKVVVTWHRINASPTFKRIVSPPVLGCIAGMVVGLLPWGKALMLGKSAPLSPVYDAIKGLGSAYLPAAILVLAGSIARPSPSTPSATPSSAPTTTTTTTSATISLPAALKGGSTRTTFFSKGNAAFAKKVAAIMVSRFMVMPLVAAAMLLSGSRIRLIPYDKLLWFVLLMEGCMPSAQNSVVILQMEKKPDLAASMARTLTAVYLLSALPIAALLSGILQFVQL